MSDNPDTKAGLKREAVGNAAAMREALERIAIRSAASRDFDPVAEIDYIHDIAESALAAPPRNCDRYSHDEALSVWAAEKENGKNGCFDEWLFAPATEQKGASNGSK